MFHKKKKKWFCVLRKVMHSSAAQITLTEFSIANVCNTGCSFETQWMQPRHAYLCDQRIEYIPILSHEHTNTTLKLLWMTVTNGMEWCRSHICIAYHIRIHSYSNHTRRILISFLSQWSLMWLETNNGVRLKLLWRVCRIKFLSGFEVEKKVFIKFLFATNSEWLSHVSFSVLLLGGSRTSWYVVIGRT